MKQYPFIVIAAAATVMFSCNKNVVDLQINNAEIDTETTYSSISKHANSLKSIVRKSNPYAVSSMRLAFTELQSQGVINLDDDIDDVVYTTHYYIKFAPQSDDEIKTLLSDTTLNLYPYPIDNNTSDENDEESAIPEDESVEGVFYYTAVPVGTELPTDIEWEVLEELYIPDEYNGENDQPSVKTRKGVCPSSDFVDNLVQKSFELTNNEDDYISLDDTRGGYKEKWRPSGRITAYDNIVDGPVPIVGICVRARRWFTIHTGCTDCDGYFSCNGRFKRPANYSFAWEGDKWDIRDGYILQAYYNGPKIKGAWDLYITSGKSLRYSAIHRAAYRFYHGNVCGLTRPANNRKEKIAYLHKSGGSTNGDFNQQWGLGIFQDIRIWGKNDYGWRDMSQIFSTTCHELGHAAHYLSNPITFWLTTDNVKESWARCVQFTLTNQEYKELDVFDKLNQKDTIHTSKRQNFKIFKQIESIDIPDMNYNFQQWNKVTGNKTYTPIFIDIVDDYYQRRYYFYKSYKFPYINTDDFPNDIISNFPVDSLEKIVFSRYTMPKIKVGLLDYCNNHPDSYSLYYLSTEHINELFAGYDY